MRKYFIVSMLVFPAIMPAQTPSTDPLAKLSWMNGCWIRSNQRSTVEEHWMPARAGTMLGMGRTIRHLAAADSLMEFEFTRIYSSNGKAVFAANPSGQTPAQFPATAQTDTSIVFSNPSHDFPQNVRYTRGGADSLFAAVDGIVNGAARRIEFRYARASC